MKTIIVIFEGGLIAIADSIPGASGRTIAYVLGIYEKMINSFSDIFSKDRFEKRKSITFLISLHFGWLVILIASVLFLSPIYEKHIYELSSFFMGLTFFIIPLIVMEEQESIINEYQNMKYTLTGAFMTVVLSLLNTQVNSCISFGNLNLSVFNLIYVFLIAVFISSMMILPGISSSLILFAFGLYKPIIMAINELFRLNFNFIPLIFVVVIGIITGSIITASIVKRVMMKSRSKMVYMIMGLMTGSLFSIAISPSVLIARQTAIDFSNLNYFLFLLGGLFMIITRAKKYQIFPKVAVNSFMFLIYGFINVSFNALGRFIHLMK